MLALFFYLNISLINLIELILIGILMLLSKLILQKLGSINILIDLNKKETEISLQDANQDVNSRFVFIFLLLHITFAIVFAVSAYMAVLKHTYLGLAITLALIMF